MSYISDNSSDSGVSLTDIDDMPFEENDKNIVNNFKGIVQKEKERVYKDTIRKTTNGTNLGNLHLYEVNLYEIGTELLKGLYDFQEANTKNISPPLWAIVKDNGLSTDARILIENEIRSQFIQYPYNQKITNNM
jgi:hypothetical protein